MYKPDDPRELVIDLIPRSMCNVQVAAVVCDEDERIISWGWNHQGATGLGMCAERYAIKRANQERLWFGYIFVAGVWRKSGKMVTAKPCEKCTKVIDKFKLDVIYRDGSGRWT